MKREVVEKELWPEILVHLRKAIRAPRKTSFVYSLEKEGKTFVLRVANVKNAANN